MYKVDCVRIGGMVTAQKDSYKRIYRPDGTYHYHRIPENILRVEGEDYFENWEITGHNEGTARNPKWSLLKYKKDDRQPFPSVYKLFEAEMTPDEILAEISGATFLTKKKWQK